MCHSISQQIVYYSGENYFYKKRKLKLNNFSNEYNDCSMSYDSKFNHLDFIDYGAYSSNLYIVLLKCYFILNWNLKFISQMNNRFHG